MMEGRESEGGSEGGDRIMKTSLLAADGPKPLTTCFNLTALFFYSFFATACGVYPGIVVAFKYFTWGFTLIDSVNCGLIFLTVSNFTQAIVAIYGDSVVTKYGRRKTFVIAGTILRVISILLLSDPPVKHTKLIFAWFALFGSIQQIGYGLLANPFASWMIESTVDEADYMKYNIVAGFIAGGIGAIFIAILTIMSPVGSAIIATIGSLISLSVIVAYVPTTVYREAPPVPRPIPSLRICIQSEEFRTILWLSILIGASASLFGHSVLFISATCFDLNKESFIIDLGLFTGIIGVIVGILLVISCNWILKKFEKIRVLVLIIFIFIALVIVSFFLTFSRSTFYAYIIVSTVVGIIGLPGGFIIGLLLRDLVIYDSFVTRYNRENMFLTAQGIPSSIIASFISTIPIVILTLSGFKSNDVDDDNLHDLYTWNSSSLWILRISSSFVAAFIAFCAFYVIRKYPLTQKVCDKINAVVKNREMMRETGDLELRNAGMPANSSNAEIPSTSVDTVSSSVLDLLEDDVPLTSDEREALLHLSAAELYRVYAAIDSTVYRPEQGVLLIKTLLKYGFSFAIFTIVIMIIALIFNMVYLDGLFSTLIIYFVLLVAFYAFYEIFRYTTVRQFLNWDQKELKLKARKVYREFTKKGDNIAVMLAREGIQLDHLMAEEEEESKLMSEFGVAPKSIIQNDLKEEDLEAEAFVGLSGYKRIFSTLTILSVLSLVVIIVSVA